jgi:hypothetical protein
MRSQRETMTDSLADIINIIHLGGKSGTLTVERGEPITVEEGFIVFVDGRVTEANVGQQQGLIAFNHLNTWRKCRFSFIDYDMRDVSTSSQAVRNSLVQSNTPLITPATPPVASVPYGVTPIPSQRNSGDLDYAAGPVEYAMGPVRLQAGEVALRYPERVQISRLQRRLLLLINGQRSLSELARLMVKSPDEIKMLLNDLERAGFIQQ